MANRRRFEEILGDLRSGAIDAEDAADELEQGYGASKLRTEAERVPELERQRDEAVAKAEKLEKAPLREKAFRDFGVDFENLRPAERDALERYEGEFEAEKVAEFVQRFDLPLAATAGQPAQEQPNAAAVVATARAAPAGKTGGGPQLTPEIVSTWSADKWLAWREQHPEESEDILQGKTVVGVPF